MKKRDQLRAADVTIYLRDTGPCGWKPTERRFTKTSGARFQDSKSSLLSQKSRSREWMTDARWSASSLSISSAPSSKPSSLHTIAFNALGVTPEGPAAFPFAIRVRAA
eukprot:9128649-Ditylum_brightwellii.AAC.1